MAGSQGGTGDVAGVRAGVDLVSVERIERLMASWGEKFLKRVYTDGEIAYSRSGAFPARSFAARFAAKEAFYKAVSPWRGGAIGHRSIEVVVDDEGVPWIRAHGNAAKALGDRSVSVSLSHEKDLAIAVVVTAGYWGWAGREARE